MPSPEMLRLARDLRQPALRETLGAMLVRCASVAEAAALLQRRGYAIEPAELAAAPGALPEAALDQVSAGFAWSLPEIQDLMGR